MNILVSGGAGFIGSHLVDAFIAAGHQVIVLDNLTTGRSENLNPGARFIEMDVRDPDVAKVFEREEIDVLCHQAAQMNVRKSVANPRFDADVNVLGSLNLFEAARNRGVEKILFASTGGAVYGEQEYFPADEKHPLRPLCPYGVSKLAVEKYLGYYGQVYGMTTIILRYANVYGPRQNPEGEAGVVAIFSEAMLAGQRPTINGDGTQTRDYVYVGDVARANLAALECRESRIYNVGTGIEHDVTTIFQMLRELLWPSCEEVHGPARLGEQRRSVIDPRKIAHELGCRPTVALEDGLRLTAEWYRSRARSSLAV